MEKGPQTSRLPTSLNESTPGSSSSNLGGGDWMSTEEWKPLNDPEVEKKLAILDIDHTLYDINGPTRDLTARPYLHEFLASVYKNYNIGIWSATTMETIQAKLDYVGMTNHPEYKLIFLMDKDAMIDIPIACKMRPLKALQAVWCKYSQFNLRNTLLCDDSHINFYLNPENGILVAPYYYTHHHTDVELLNLKKYLETIATSEDFSKIDHSKWYKQIQL